MTAVRRELHVVSVLGFFVALIAFGLWFLWSQLVISVSTDRMYFDPTDPDDLAVVAERVGRQTLTWGIILAVAVVVVVVSVRAHRGGWIWLGIVLAGMGVLVLIAASASWFSFTAEPHDDSQPPLTPAATGVPTRDAAYTEMQRMITASLAAVRDQTNAFGGGPLTTDDVRISAESCNVEGTLLSADFTFFTEEPTAAEDILTVWDSAGYQPNGALQTDIRYSSLLPVAKMVLDDTSTVNGHVRMQIVSQCTKG